MNILYVSMLKHYLIKTVTMVNIIIVFSFKKTKSNTQAASHKHQKLLFN